jgi:response regulator RpfG family c-di-GMP phosphodiesterase
VNEAPVTLLVVDDEEAIRKSMRKYLALQGYEVATAASGEEALAVLERQKVTGMLLDVNLPGVNGVDLVPRILELEPSLAILMLTAVNDATSAALCMQRGALDYLIKPVDLPRLRRAIESALQRRHTLLEGQQINRWLKEEVAQRVAEKRLEQANQERVSVATLDALVNALEAKDPYLRGHSARVADLSASVAAQLGCDDELVEAVRTAGRLHDIGKIGIRDAVLQKPGKLTDEEYDHIKQHPDIGARLTARFPDFAHGTRYVRHHHERWDGRGYPSGLKGKDTPLGARVIAVADTYDAITSSRVYREGLDDEFAREEMARVAGTQLDHEVVEAWFRAKSWQWPAEEVAEEAA